MHSAKAVTFIDRGPGRHTNNGVRAWGRHFLLDYCGKPLAMHVRLRGSAYVTSIGEVVPIHRCVSSGGDGFSNDCQHCACCRVESLVPASNEARTKRFGTIFYAIASALGPVLN